MAADNLSNISSALGQTFAPQLIRAWNRSSVTLQAITFLPGGGAGGGKNVAWDVEFSGAKAASFAEGADLSAGELDQDLILPASLPWAQYRAPFQLSNLEINAASANLGNPVELEKILEERFYGAITKITSTINSDVISGDGTDGSSNPTIIGLVTALASTGTYATIVKTDHAEWAGNVSANSGTARPLTMELLSKADQQLFVACGGSSEMILTTPGIRTKYEGLFQSVTRVVQDGGAPIQSYNGSADAMFWRGQPVIREKDMPTGTMVMLMASEVEMRVLPWAPVPDGVPVTLRDMLSSTGNAAQSLGAYVHIYPLARTGSAVKFMAEIYLQLKVKRPNQHVLIQDISEV